VQLGILLVGAGKFKEAREQLIAAKGVAAEQAPEYFRALAYANYRLGMKEEAKIAAERARKYVKTPQAAEWLDNFLRHLDQPFPPVGEETEEAEGTEGTKDEESADASARERVEEPQRPKTLRRRKPDSGGTSLAEAPGGRDLFPAEGTLVQVDCLGGVARLWLESGGDKIAFAITDPKSVVIRKGGQDITHEFKCGAQQPARVILHYELKPNARLETTGVVRRLEFK
jgi:hypothetical protein